MVRILKVKELDDRRQLLLDRSELHRQMLRAEVEAFHVSSDRLRQRFDPIQNWRGWLGIVAPVAGFLLGRSRKHEEKSRGGFFSRILSGIKLAAEIIPLVTKFTTATKEPEAKDAPEDYEPESDNRYT